MSVRVVELGDVCEINPRAPKNIPDETVVSFLPMSAVSELGFLSFEELRTYREVKKGYTYFERGDVLIAKITPCFENGKATVTDKIRNQIGFGSTEFHVVRPSPQVDAQYIFFLLWSGFFRIIGEKSAVYEGEPGYIFNNNILRVRFNSKVSSYFIAAYFQTERGKRELEARKAGTTSVFAIYQKALNTICIPVPPLELQEKYASLVQQISAKRAQLTCSHQLRRQ